MGIIQIHGHSFHPHFLNSDSVVLDLGSNHGDFARSVADRFGCTCFVVEGNPVLAAKLQEDPRLKATHALIGDAERTALFSITENDQCSSVMQPTSSTVLRQEYVRMVSLPSLCTELNLQQIDLLKMDIEGAEISALNVCSDAFLKQVGQLAVEFHESVGFTSMSEIQRISERLQRLGFEWIRGTFSNYEDNLFINRALCPLNSLGLLYNRTIARYWNGVLRVIARRKRIQ